MLWPGYCSIARRSGWSLGNCSFLCSCRVSRRYRIQFMVTRSKHPFSTRFPSSLVSPVVTRTLTFAKKIARTSSLEIKEFSASFSFCLQYIPGLWNSCLAKPRQSLNRSCDCVEVFGNMLYKTLSCVEKDQLIIGVSYTGWSRHVHASRAWGRKLLSSENHYFRKTTI